MLPAQVVLYMLVFCRIVTGLVFCVSSAGKIRNFVQFRQSVHNFALIPPQFGSVMAVLILVVEFALVLCFIVGGMFLVLGFLLALFLFVVFCIALASVLIRKISTSCSCFGVNTNQVSILDVWRNIGFMICCVVGLVSLAILKQTQEVLNPAEWGIISLVSAIFVVIWIQLGDIVQIFRQA